MMKSRFAQYIQKFNCNSFSGYNSPNKSTTCPCKSIDMSVPRDAKSKISSHLQDSAQIIIFHQPRNQLK